MTANRAAIINHQKLRPEIIVCLLLCFATLVIYWQSSGFDFVSFDDDLYVTHNSHVKQGLTPSNLVWAFQSLQASNWHPLTWISHMLDVELYGMHAGGHHLTSVLFHIANSLLVLLIFRKMTGQLGPSAVVAGLFALHPLHVESVAWIAERKDVLSMFFWMLTLAAYLWYIERPEIKRYLSVLLLFILGLMAKPMLVTLPFVLLLLDYWPLERFSFRRSADPSGRPWSMSLALPLLWEKVPLLVFSSASVLMTIFVQQRGGAIGTLETYPLSSRIANALIAYVSYLGKTIWPSNLAVLYPYPDHFTGCQVAGALSLLVVLLGLALKFLKQKPWLAVGWLWYTGTLVPVIGLVQIGNQAMADRYTYIPLTGVFIVIAWGVCDLISSWYRPTERMAILSIPVFIMLMLVSWTQVRSWKNSISLYEHTIDVTTNNYIIHNNLGFALTAKGKWGDAQRHYQEALRINPDYETANLNIGLDLLAQGKIERCIDYYQSILQDKPRYAKVHNNLGVLLLNQGEVEKALNHFRDALHIEPDYAEAYNGLGVSMKLGGEPAKAIVFFQEALQIKPDYIEARNNLSQTLAAMKKLQVPLGSTSD